MKKVKKLVALAGVLTLALSLAGCGSANTSSGTQAQSGSSGSSAGTAAAPASASITVAGVVFQEDQFMKLLTIGYQDAAKAAGVKCLVGNSGNDVAKESQLINTYQSQKVSGLVIAPLNKDSSVAALQKASDNGMKIAVTNINLNNAPFIVGGYTSDDKNLGATSGKAAAQFIKDKLNGNAKIAIIQFKSQVPQQSADRVNGFLDEVKKVNPNVQVVADQDAWLQDKAVAVAGDILTAHPDVNIIFGANDGGTIGSVMAVKNAGLAGKAFVYGIDTGDQQIAMLKSPDNILQAVTGQDPYNMGYKAMETLIKAIKGEDVSATKGKSIIVPGTLLSRDNPDGIAKFEADLKAKMGN